MSACWASDRTMMPLTMQAHRLGRFGLVLGALRVPAPARGGARTRPAAADRGGVSRVRVSPEGVEVTRDGSTRTYGSEAASGPRSRSQVSVGRRGIHINVDEPDSGSSRVDVDVPHVRVNGPVGTMDGEPAGLVRVFADVHVPPGAHVDGDVVAVFGSATVEGQVSGSVVAVFGSVKLLPGAAVEQDAVAVGGVLDQAPGTVVKGETVSVGFLPLSFGAPTLGVLLVTIFTGWLPSRFMAWRPGLAFP